ncbi:MAG: aspartate/glutamate racemase family protein [Firmicutes bacterium]|nr:aspartate/glutamate racemase family protein [Bacillota bacterium]MCL1953924.1 aspartate/glutamate racemase family protein [Bacillota bacterium]
MNESLRDDRPIGVLDSGIGGMSTLLLLKDNLPYENFVYSTQREFVSFGNMVERDIYTKSIELVDVLIYNNSKVVVIACNTATNVGVGNLSQKFGIPFIGCEPAIKPCVESGCKNILVLTTVATARQPKFLELKERFGNYANIIVAPQPYLARCIEESHAGKSLRNNIKNGVYALPDNFYQSLHKELYNCVANILYNSCDIDGVVLGCTHYVFLKPMIEYYCQINRKQIKIFDGNSGIVKRLKNLV